MEQKIPREFIDRFVAEFIGTTLLAMVLSSVLFGNAVFPAAYQALYTPFIVGAIIAVLVYVFGSISGAHFNPAVSVGMWSIHKIHLPQLITHLLAQLLGAFVGITLTQIILVPTGFSIPFNSGMPAILGEFIGTFILVLAIAAVTLKRTPEAVSGIVIGLAIACGITISVIPSGGILNPAIAIASGAFHVSYLVSPFLAAILAAFVANWLFRTEIHNF